MNHARVLIAGIGNIFLGDDAFGVEVAQGLARRTLPPGVRVEDFGIRGLDLAYALAESCNAAILIDAVHRGGQPGTLYVIEPEAGNPSARSSPIEAHDLDPEKVLAMVQSMRPRCARVLILGCETVAPDPDDLASAMSPAVRAAIVEAVGLAETLAKRLLRELDAESETAPGAATPDPVLANGGVP